MKFPTSQTYGKEAQEPAKQKRKVRGGLRDRSAEAAFFFGALKSVAARAERIVIRLVPEKLEVAFVRALVSGHCCDNELAAMSDERIAAEGMSAEKMLGVGIPFRVVALRASRWTRRAMRFAKPFARQLWTARRSAWMFWF
jgi:hypothetical protein